MHLVTIDFDEDEHFTTDKMVAKQVDTGSKAKS